jgi:hypothetical protein
MVLVAPVTSAVRRPTSSMTAILLAAAEREQ